MYEKCIFFFYGIKEAQKPFRERAHIRLLNSQNHNIDVDTAVTITLFLPCARLCGSTLNVLINFTMVFEVGTIHISLYQKKE